MIWQLDSREVSHRLHDYVDTISSGAWWPDSRFVAVGSLQGRVDVWNAENVRRSASLNLHDQIQSVAVTPAGLLLVGDRGGTVTVLSRSMLPPADNMELVPITGWPLHQNRVYGLAASPKDDRIASTSRDGTVAVTELQLRHSVRQSFYEAETFWPTHRCVAGPDAKGRRFGTTPDGFAMFSPDLRVAPQQMLPRQNVRDVALNGDRLLAAHRNELLLWNLRDDLRAPERIPVLNGSEQIYHVEWLDGTHILLQCGTSHARLWDLRANQSEHIWRNRHYLAVSPDRRWFALAEDKGYQLTLYDAATRQPVWTAFGHSEPIRSLVFDSRGTSLFSGSEDRTIIQWDLATGRERLRLRGHEGAVHLLAASPDSRTLASCDRTNRVWLWDLRSGRPLYELDRHSDGFSWLEFTADGDELWGIDMWRAEHHWSCRSLTTIQPSVKYSK